MSEKGKIVKISGPLVIAQGIPEARMFDVVRVGETRLIGEILEIKGDLTSIQVYEETGGLKPGEPVESLYQPLSVELAPGLLGNIYDGIQRPLDEIKAKEGDFITRGIETRAIDREKEWEFKPEVEEGDKVTAGDILGTVQETEIVEHRILVPPGIEGKVKSVHSGKAKVEDTIAIIQTKKEEKKISMLQRWPVRQMRPYKEQLEPQEPLVTGQRVIDTFFPIAKGGTACIPGPFGSGKCVAGDTPVLLGDGTLTRMEDLYHKCAQEGYVTHDNGHETVVEIKPSLSFFSLNTTKIEKTSSNIAYKGKSEYLVKIRTRSGREVKVTPVHKLFKVNHVGEIVPTEARELAPGDFLLSIRRTKADNKNAKFNLYQLKDARVVDSSIREKVSKILRKLRKKGELSDLGITKTFAESFIYKRNLPSLSLVQNLYSYEGFSLPDPQMLRGARGGQHIHIPSRISPQLGELLGLFIAEGNLREPNTVVFTNEERRLKEKFSKLITLIFGIKSKKEFQKGKTASILVLNKILVDFFKSLGVDDTASQKKVPPLILKSSDKVISSFLRGYYLGDGGFCRGEIEFCTASKDLYTGLCYCLTRLGILYSSGKKKIKGRNYYRLFIRGVDNLKSFYEAIGKDEEKFRKIEKIEEYINSKKRGYTSYDIVPLSTETITKIYKESGLTYTELKKAGIEISNYTTNGEHMSSSSFKTLAQFMKKKKSEDEKFKHILRLASLLDDVFCDKITGVERVEGPANVYDICIPGKENFVGGNAPMLLHNTVVQHQLSKWANARVIVFVGCGERGNEMTDVLREFPQLKDPTTGKPLMQRTILIANTSNMPVAAREASIYTGITLAEYYRDMGYDVALMADSTSRWAEALREMSGRLEEMPGEEGYPAYLPSRLAEFYERAGRVINLGKDKRISSLSAIGAVSPPGGDLSEPVTQATLRVVRVFWALVAELAYQRHFPAIHWLRSYSLYLDELKGYFTEKVADDWARLREKAMALLQKEDELQETVRLVGLDVLSPRDRIAMETARSIREDFLQQFAFHEVDTYSPLGKQYSLLKLVLDYHDLCIDALQKGAELDDLINLSIREQIARAKYVSNEEAEDKIEELREKLKEQIRETTEKKASKS